MRASVLSYFNDNNIQFPLLPEFGIGFLGFANLTYGYNFKLSKHYNCESKQPAKPGEDLLCRVRPSSPVTG